MGSFEKMDMKLGEIVILNLKQPGQIVTQEEKIFLIVNLQYRYQNLFIIYTK